jgi:hypothetical protein
LNSGNLTEDAPHVRRALRRYKVILGLNAVLGVVAFVAAAIGGLAALVSRGLIVGVVVFVAGGFVLRVAVFLVYLLLCAVFVGPAVIRQYQLDKEAAGN